MILCCERCGQQLDPDKAVWLTFDQRTNTYTDQPVPPEYDQGGFPFGSDCAKRELSPYVGHVLTRGLCVYAIGKTVDEARKNVEAQARRKKLHKSTWVEFFVENGNTKEIEWDAKGSA